MWTNAGAEAGDVLFLTKPLGTGVVGTAIKFDRVPSALAEEAVRWMCTLNRAASEALQALPHGAVHACTDVTGFGLIGHAAEMAASSHVTVRIEANRVPLLTGVASLARENRSGGMASNEEHYGAATEIAASVPDDVRSLLFDPQTSGGLLIAAARQSAGRVGEALEESGLRAARIGEVGLPIAGVPVVVRP
jgi:selenide,water dikinase